MSCETKSLQYVTINTIVTHWPLTKLFKTRAARAHRRMHRMPTGDASRQVAATTILYPAKDPAAKNFSQNDAARRTIMNNHDQLMCPEHVAGVTFTNHIQERLRIGSDSSANHTDEMLGPTAASLISSPRLCHRQRYFPPHAVRDLGSGFPNSWGIPRWCMNGTSIYING